MPRRTPPAGPGPDELAARAAARAAGRGAPTGGGRPGAGAGRGTGGGGRATRSERQALGRIRPLPVRHVLVGTDGSVTATEAVRRAATTAVAFGARLTVACAYALADSGSPAAGGGVLGQLAATTEAPERDEVPADLRWRVSRAAEAEEVARRAADLASALGCLDVATAAVPGDPAAALLELAASLPADLLVVGSKGMRSWTRFVLGSVPNTISHHAPCDVLIVRTDR